jgi:hypothetical protein
MQPLKHSKPESPLLLMSAACDRLQDWAVPQAWFLHFYVLGSCCNAVVLLLYCLSSPPSSTATQVVSGISSRSFRQAL